MKGPITCSKRFSGILASPAVLISAKGFVSFLSLKNVLLLSARTNGKEEKKEEYYKGKQVKDKTEKKKEYYKGEELKRSK
ncbi:MAG: hypothetical protein ACXV5H_11320 [Halobacteriota archaeon]